MLDNLVVAAMNVHMRQDWPSEISGRGYAACCCICVREDKDGGLFQVWVPGPLKFDRGALVSVLRQLASGLEAGDMIAGGSFEDATWLSRPKGGES
jgi:hypothetical protein